MADETKQAIDAAADTAKAATEAAGTAAKKSTETAEAASKRTAKTAKRAVKKTTRRAKAQRRTRGPARKPAAAAVNQRTNKMTYSANDWFAAFAPTATPFQTIFADAGERGQDAIRRSQKAVEQFADLTRGNVEAVVEAGRVAVEGARAIGQDVVETGREHVEQAADAVRSFAEAKSATEFMQLHTDFARASFDRLVNESSRLTESMVKLAGEALQPISNRASVSAERINKLVA